MSGNARVSLSRLSRIADPSSPPKSPRSFGENSGSSRNYPQPSTLRPTENQNESTKKSSNTCAFVETSSRTIGPCYSPLSSSRTTRAPTAAPINPPSRSGMASSQNSNHHSSSRLESKASMNASSTLNKSVKKLRPRSYLPLKKCGREDPLPCHILSTKTTSSYSKPRISRPRTPRQSSHLDNMDLLKSSGHPPLIANSSYPRP